MSSITLEQAIQHLIARTSTTDIPLPLQATFRHNLLCCEFDIALSALYLVQFALGQTDDGPWDSDLPPRISLFQRTLTALCQHEDTTTGVVRSDIFSRIMQDNQPANPKLRRLCKQHVEALGHELQQLAQKAGYEENDTVEAQHQPLLHHRRPSRWELVTAFAALHCIQAIVFQDNQYDILRRIEQLDRALDCWWQSQRIEG